MGLLSIFRRKPEAPPPEPQQVPVRSSRPRYYSMRALTRAMEGMFGAAGVDRLNASWPSFPQPTDWIIRRHQRELVARSRQQTTQNDYAKAFLRLCRQNIVGPYGIQLQAQSRADDGSLDKAVNDAIEDAWWQWGKRENCDVTGCKSFVSLQLSAVQTAAKDGEFMFRKIYGRDAGPWGFALQWLDPQRCPVDYDVDRYAPGRFIRHGIEFNQYGRPLAYHFTTTDESEVEYRYGGRAFVRVPAEEIIHGFKDELGGQKRGLPWMATALFRMRNVGGFEDAAIVNARVSAAKMGFIQFKDGEGPEFDEENPPEIDAEAGVFEVLPGGAEFKEWNPQYPSGEFAPFTKHMLRSIAAGLGVPYNEFANDLEGVNFSSIRQGTLDSRERWKEDQEWLIEQLLGPVFQAWLPIALLSNRIKIRGRPLRAERIAQYEAVTWQPRRWQWIDPQADVKAAVEAKNNLLLPPGQIIREQGRDPSEVYREIAQDIEEMRAAGIPEDYIKLAMGQKLTSEKKADEEKVAA